MSLNKFMQDNFLIIKDEIIKNIPDDKFDSHEFIRLFSNKFEVEYVEFLSKYSQEPFRKVNAQIGNFLSDHHVLLEIKSDGNTQSPNVFGIESPIEKRGKISLKK